MKHAKLLLEIAGCRNGHSKEALLAGATALKRGEWRPISNVHEDHGPVILIDMRDPGHQLISHVCSRDWDVDSEGMTHFAQLPDLATETAERLLDELDGKEGSGIGPV